MGNTALLPEPLTDKETEDGKDERLAYAVSSMQGWRKNMEDAHTAVLNCKGGYEGDDYCSIFGVYDGHGGKDVAIYIGKHLHTQLQGHQAFAAGSLELALRETYMKMDVLMKGDVAKKEFNSFDSDADEEQEEAPDDGTTLTLKQALRKDPSLLAKLPAQLKPMGEAKMKEIEQEAKAAQAKLKGEAEGEGGAAQELWEPDSGTTAVVAVVRGDTLTCANAGDSRCVLCRAGEAVPMSFDHKPEDKTERDRIYAAGSHLRNNRVNGMLALSRALGDFTYKKNKQLSAEAQAVTANPDIKTVRITPQDEFVLLACDGIWDVMSNQQAVDFVRGCLLERPAPALTAVCERLLDACCSTDGRDPGTDNETAMIVVLKAVEEGVERPTKKLKTHAAGEEAVAAAGGDDGKDEITPRDRNGC